MIDKITKRKFISALENIEYGSLFLSLPDSSDYFFEGSKPGPHADLGIHKWSVIRNLARHGDVGLAGDYYNGLWESSNLEELFTFGIRNEASMNAYLRGTILSRFMEQITYLFRMNSVKGSRRNIHQHYDLGNAFYSLWLDSTMTYSSALYLNSDDNLPTAQANKYDRLLDRIEDDRGSILEIGCGWGGFAERALYRQERPITGLTLSTEQLEFSRNRVHDNARFELQDYRHATGLYDSIVSIEMFEAVGMRYWNQYFAQVNRLLKKGGKALVQSILIEDSVFESYRRGSDVIRSYIFPGGMLPSNERFTEAANRGGMKVTDRFFFGNDYARTLREWLKRFERALPEIRQLGFDEPFIRLWKYYLASCAAGFKEGRINVAQYELQHP